MNASGGGAATGRRVLVAGIGNIFLGDDGFGVEVVSHIDPAELPGTVEVRDYGIRGVHLAYELLDRRHDTLIMVDAVPVEGPPGTLAVLEVGTHAGTGTGTGTGTDADAATGPAGGADTVEVDGDTAGAVPIDGHGMNPEAVLRLLDNLGGGIGRVLIVGCRPARIDEHMGLSAPVSAAVADAVRLVTELAGREAAREMESSHA
jgi:hydrogenase maturation protease